MPEKHPNQITAHGGWIEEKRTYQKKALLFKTLAILWLFPSITALFVIGYDFPRTSGVFNTVKLIRIEQWLSLALLLLQPVFAYLAVYHRRHEMPTEHVFLVPDSQAGKDPKNLY